MEESSVTYHKGKIIIIIMIMIISVKRKRSFTQQMASYPKVSTTSPDIPRITNSVFLIRSSYITRREHPYGICSLEPKYERFIKGFTQVGIVATVTPCSFSLGRVLLLKGSCAYLFPKNAWLPHISFLDSNQ